MFRIYLVRVLALLLPLFGFNAKVLAQSITTIPGGEITLAAAPGESQIKLSHEDTYGTEPDPRSCFRKRDRVVTQHSNRN